MKKVRFESPIKCVRAVMEDSECHSPRPFIDKQETTRPELCLDYPRLLPYNPDPVQRYECSNSSPYPIVAKTTVDKPCSSDLRWPSNDLELSMLDSSYCEPRNTIRSNHRLCSNPAERIFSKANDKNVHAAAVNHTPNVLTPIENSMHQRLTGKSIEHNNFFIKRDNLNKFNSGHIGSLQSHLDRFNLNKENDPLAKKAEIMQMAAHHEPFKKITPKAHNTLEKSTITPHECRCHNCVQIIQNTQCGLAKDMNVSIPTSCQIMASLPKMEQACTCSPVKEQPVCPCSHHVPAKPIPNTCSCHKPDVFTYNGQKNAVDKKTWMIERYGQKIPEGMEIEKQTAGIKEKREPTVSDLFKIIKLQNEQLQILQDKVDKFISASTNNQVNPPIQNYVTEHVTLETIDNEQHKISIGVMTSFEMVRTSTVFNKGIVTQTNENAQIQCNRSQISIKEVVSKKQPATLNFLDGIMPVDKAASVPTDNAAQDSKYCDTLQQTENMNDDKTLNEFSLYNVQVDNATTPQLSPQQSLYLDVRDYSDSDSCSDDQSNVGWTYYNKVMTHVNGVLQDSEMPSSASALFRNTKQQCVQMQIDKSNLSVTKRVKFGDDPLGIHQPHLYTSTDTSMKMNQLAAKYLKGAAASLLPIQVPVHKPTTTPIEMSFATRDYMERHRILQGNAVTRSPPPGELPRFLDITALKQQPKLL